MGTCMESRSTWACELKWTEYKPTDNGNSHAPRERVSWNREHLHQNNTLWVTLHVSVWVEIGMFTNLLKRFLSRSTWACELKWRIQRTAPLQCSHAPRERVSWNTKFPEYTYTPGESRSTWACELKFQKSYNYTLFITSRSTWACELKSRNAFGHICTFSVTLHVSVWVEMHTVGITMTIMASHAPRERVSQLSFQRRTYRYWIIQITAWLRSGGIFIPKYYTFFMCFSSNPPIHTPKFVQTNDL